MSHIRSQPRDRAGKFSAVQHPEASSITLDTDGSVEDGAVLVDLDSYEYVKDEAEITRQVKMMVAIAKRSGGNPENAGAWLREFDGSEKRLNDIA